MSIPPSRGEHLFLYAPPSLQAQNLIEVEIKFKSNEPLTGCCQAQVPRSTRTVFWPPLSLPILHAVSMYVPQCRKKMDVLNYNSIVLDDT